MLYLDAGSGISIAGQIERCLLSFYAIQNESFLNIGFKYQTKKVPFSLDL